MLKEYYGEEMWFYIYKSIHSIKPNYAISNYDRVMNTDTNFILKPRIDSKGYVVYSLRDINGNAINIHLHRLKMLMFCYIPGCENLTVDHKDCNKLNNSISNLQWVTQSENTKRAYENNLHKIGEDFYNALFTNDEVEEICSMLSNGVDIKDIVSFAESTIYPKKSSNMASIIYSILHRESWVHISNKYTFHDYSQNRFSDNEVITICELLQDGKKYDYIIEKLGYNLASMTKQEIEMLRTRLSGIKNKRYYTDISRNYKFPNNDIKLISDDKVHKICKLIASTKLTNSQIVNEIFGALPNNATFIKMRRSVNEIRQKITHKSISDQYF